MIDFISKYKRSILYGLLTTLMLAASYESIRQRSLKVFIVVMILSGIFYIIELNISWYYAKRYIDQLELNLSIEYNLRHHLLNHLILPIALFYSFVGFIYFKQDRSLEILTIILSFCLQTLLFINIRSFYENNFKMEQRTHYIYDLMKLFLFFFASNVLVNIYLNYGNLYAVILALGLLSMQIMLLIIHRHDQFNLSTFIYSLITSVLISLMYIVLLQYYTSAMLISFMGLVVFYVVAAALHHKLDGTLTFKILTEYFIIVLLAALLLISYLL